MPQSEPAFTLRRAIPADWTYIEALNERSYRDLVLRQFGAWNAAAQREKLDGKWRHGCYEIVLLAGQRGGAFSLEEHPDHLFLADVQIAASAQGRGLGSRIVEEAVARARARRLPLRLRVLHLNRARALYERLGFRQYGITDTHYLMEKPVDTA